MTKPVAERIADDVLEALSSIRVAGGYRFDATVIPASPTSDAPRGDCFLTISVGDPQVPEEKPINFDEYDLPFSIAYERVRSDADTTRSADALRAEVFGEVNRALMQDYTRGGLAIYTRNWSHSKTDNDGDGSIGGVVSFSVWYRTVQDDVFSSAFES